MAHRDSLIYYIKRHLTKAQFEALVEAGVPLTGPNGVRRWLAERDFEAFVRLFFAGEFILDFPPIHREFIADIEEIRARQIDGRPGVKLSRAIPRGHAKTTFFARLLPLWGFLYGWSPLTVILGNNSTAARRLLKNIREICETNEAIREDFPGLAEGVWQDERIEYGTSAIVCFGVGSGAIRGVSKPNARPSLIIGDDLDDDESVRSAVILEANIEWFDKGVMALGDQVRFTTSFVVCGTVIRKTSLMSHILASPDFSAIVQRGVLKFADNGALWDEWRAWFLDKASRGEAPKDPQSDSFYQQHKTEMLKGAQVLWERPDAYYTLMVYRLSRGDAAFSSEIQNHPGEVGGSLGTMKLVAALPNDVRFWRRYAALDTTVRGGKSNDLAAWVELLLDVERKRMYVVHCSAVQRPYSETIDYVISRLKQRGVQYDGFWVETNGSGFVIADLLEDRIAKEGIYYIPQRVNHSAKKGDRIAALPEYIAREQLFVLQSVDSELVNEFDGYPGYRFDDAIDCLATIVLQLKSLGFLDLVVPDF